MVKDINEANRIVGKMAKERYRSSADCPDNPLVYYGV